MDVYMLSKNRKISIGLAILVVGGVSVFAGLITYYMQRAQETIPVGIIHALTGSRAELESNVVNGTLLAINQINEAGGVLGKKIRPIMYDTQSNEDLFAPGVDKLVTEDGVVAIFGCWTSSSRKNLLPAVERHKTLLFYPLQYEGLEESPYVVYVGATANQQVVPGAVWALKNLGKKFFITGSDYVYPRASNALARYVIEALGGSVVGEEYVRLGDLNVDHIITAILKTQPEVIFNNITDAAGIEFFKKLRAAGISPERVPCISFVFSEFELQRLDIASMIGDYVAINYFQSVESVQNDRFVQAYKRAYGENAVTNDYVESAYTSVYLWSLSVQEAGSFETEAVRKALKNQSFSAPGGVLSVDQNNQHVWKKIRVGKIQPNGQFNIVWTSDRPVRPFPYLTEYLTREQWDEFVQSLYVGWGNKWSA